MPVVTYPDAPEAWPQEAQAALIDAAKAFAVAMDGDWPDQETELEEQLSALAETLERLADDADDVDLDWYELIEEDAAWEDDAQAFLLNWHAAAP
jgi:hypothetical protein